MDRFTGTEKKILNTALAMISKKGSFDITIRELADEAQVNIAAINYHFRTKENMLEYVKEFYMENTQNSYEKLKDSKLSPREKIRNFSMTMIETSLTHPGLLNLLEEIYKNSCDDERFMKIVEVDKKLDGELDKLLREVFTYDSEEEYQYKKTIYVSLVVYPGTVDSILGLDCNLVKDEDKRLKYIDYALELLI